MPPLPLPTPTYLYIYLPGYIAEAWHRVRYRLYVSAYRPRSPIYIYLSICINIIYIQRCRNPAYPYGNCGNTIKAQNSLQIKLYSYIFKIACR